MHFDAKLVRSLPPKTLPRDWRASPPPAGLRAIGDAWVGEGETAVLAVPSAIVESERIFLVNPAQTAFSRLHRGRPRAFAFDARLNRRRGRT